MKIQDGPALASAEREERLNLAEYMKTLSLWTYRYINTDNGHILERVTAAYTNKQASINIQRISPQEIGIIALAARYLKLDIPNASDTELQREIAEYQFALQQYLGITDPTITTNFYVDIISSLKSEHLKLGPIIHTYHTQIHALKIAYDALKGDMANADSTTRVLFGLICIEFMKLNIRLYLIEPLARAEEGKNLDWIYMLDTIFEDFSLEHTDNTDASRNTNVIRINQYHEAGLHGILRHIKEIRDEVDALKREKLGMMDEGRLPGGTHTTSPANQYLQILEKIRQQLGNAGI